MVGLIVLLLVIWAIIAILGFTLKGLIWLAIIGIVLFIITGAVGWTRRSALHR
ncbi:MULTISPECIES: hypothetical protein [unclassified Arthrobacter]|uniref:hypothetical protein n=1 Tax=unclassified Arthrobacter TaxID=235627 RepID=UPI00159E1738|nr:MULTISPECIES: hypothetical protein [unclassified Arthrobacter]MCQ9165979.1 hypothetical protein [Arthrobacter sp. STN4]NVM98689.1 hypothetical protein [Arthrobacter sp. SDTb3-6]